MTSSAVPRPRSTAYHQLLRSAVALHLEDLMRTVGALAEEGRDVREWVGLVERDARDLAQLATVAVAAGARLPAGLEGGGGDPHQPGSAIEGLLASHEALLGVLRELASSPPPPGGERVARAITDILARREEDVAVLRALGAGHGLPEETRLKQGALPKYQA